jgi:hypothetical protein
LLLCNFSKLEGTEITKSKKRVFARIFKSILWLCVIAILLLISSVLLVFVYEDEVKGIIVKELNKHLKTEVRIDPKNIDLTFISSFPKCAIEFKDFVAMETWNKKQRDTLIFASSLSLRFSIKDIFDKKYNITRIALDGAKCYMKVDQKGNLNYEVWKTDLAEGGSSDSVNFKLEDISIQNSKLVYRNKEQKIRTDVEIRKISFSGKFGENDYSLTSKGDLFVHTLQVAEVNYIKNKDLKADVELAVTGDNYQIKNADIQLNRMYLSVIGSLQYKDSLENISLQYDGKNLDIGSVLSLLPDKYKDRVNEYKSSGEFYVKGKYDQVANKDPMIYTSFGIKNASIEYRPKSTVLSNVNLKGEFSIGNSTGKLSLRDISANLKGNNFTGNFSMVDFNDPQIDVSAKGTFDLKEVLLFWPIDTLEKLEGTLDFNGEVTGAVSELKQQALSEKVKMAIQADVKGLVAKFKNDKKEFKVETCKITAKGRDVKVEDLKLIKGNSDVNVTGEIPGLFNHLLDRKAPLIIIGDLKSKFFDPDDFIYTSGSAQNSEFNVPSHIQLKLDASVESFAFREFKAKNINGNFELKNQKMMLSEMKLETMDGKAEVNALVDASGKMLEVNLQSHLEKMNIRQMFADLNNFGQSTLTDKNVNGIVTADIDFSGNWDKLLNADLKSIVSLINLHIEQGELNDFKPLESLSKFVDINDLKRIKFASLTSTVNIYGQKIFMEKTSLKNSALNIEFSGMHTFDNNIDYHIRLLISDLLAKKRKADDEFGPVENDPDKKRCAFILMTGNIDNIKIRYDKQGMKQKIREDMKEEKQSLKQLFKEELGLFKNDSIQKKDLKKADQKFELEKPDNKKEKKTLEPKKKGDEDDDF